MSNSNNITLGSPLPQSVNATGRKQTEKQRLAGERNFALFILRGMRGHLYHVRKALGPDACLSLQAAINNCIEEIERNPHVTTQE